MVFDPDRKEEDMFKREAQFDDDDNMLVNSSGPFQKAQLTSTPGGTAKPLISNMYDMNTATETIINDASGTGTFKWKFAGKPRFKNVFVSYRYDKNAANGEFYLEGSNDDSAWTEIVHHTVTADGSNTMIGTDVNWKYLRVRVVQTEASAAWITSIMGTT